MARIKMQWVNMGWGCSFQSEIPQTKRAFERTENKKINHQVKHINRNQQNIRFAQFGRTR